MRDKKRSNKMILVNKGMSVVHSSHLFNQYHETIDEMQNN